jgi:hypothetical protein
MDSTTKMELFEFLRKNLSISMNMSTEYESCSEYATCNVSLSLINPETGEVEEIANAYDSVSISKD